jgi:hypothetical protein
MKKTVKNTTLKLQLKKETIVALALKANQMAKILGGDGGGQVGGGGNGKTTGPSGGNC